MSWPEPYRTWASSSARRPRPRIRRGASSSTPRAHAPPPRRAHQRSRSAGAEMTAAWSSPSRSTARSVPNSGHAADEVVGPVDRVDVPAGRGVAGLGAVLLADEPVVRVRRRDPRPDDPLDRRVGLGHERPVGLRRDLEVAAEHRSGDHVGLVAGRVGEREPRLELRLRHGSSAALQAAPNPPDWSRASADRSATRSRRIRAFVGSQSGSRTTSKPTHSPKTSISPRVPIGASGGR